MNFIKDIKDIKDTKNTITILMGKSCAGKDTLLNQIVKNEENTIKLISHTTRPKRPNEVDGVDYHFVDTTDYFRIDREKRFATGRTYSTKDEYGFDTIWRYGLLIDEEVKKDMIVILDIPAAKTILDRYGEDKCVLIFVDAPEEVRKERCKKRGDFSEEQWQTRKEADDTSFQNIKERFPNLIYYNNVTKEEIQAVQKVTNNKEKGEETHEK